MSLDEKPNLKPELKTEKLLETVGKVRRRIGNRFPDSGLFGIAGEVEGITRQALSRTAAIRRPNWWLRIGLGLLFVLLLVAVIVNAPTRNEQLSFWKSVLEFLDATKVGVAILTATVIYLVTLETRRKRHRAIQAIHELRAMAHLIDMHQLTKTPEKIGHPTEPVDVAGRLMSADDMAWYLNYCTDLLALLSKVGHLYVQNFSDGATLTAVDHFESLATGLSSKIWQKLTILDRIRSDSAGGQHPIRSAPLHA
jgi:hypothetical protein